MKIKNHSQRYTNQNFINVQEFVEEGVVHSSYARGLKFICGHIMAKHKGLNMKESDKNNGQKVDIIYQNTGNN